MSDAFGKFLQGYSTGNALKQQRQEEQRRMQLGELLSGARGATGAQRDGFMSQAYGVDAQGAMAAEQQFAELDDMKAAQLGRMASVFVSMPAAQRAQAWPTIRQELAQIIPGQYPDAWDEQYLPVAQSLVQQLGGGSGVPAGYQEFDLLARDAGLTPEDRALAARRALYLDRRPSNAAMKYEGVAGDDGRERLFALDPNNPNATQIGGGASYGAPQGGDVFAGLESIPGIQITSGYRSQADNVRVDGVPNSYHKKNLARDFLPPQTREQAQAVLQWAEANNMEVLDEGDHWHTEPRGNAPQGGVNPFVSRRPEDEAYAEELAKGQAGLQLAPAQAAAKAEETRAVETAKADVKREANAPKRTAKARFEIDRARRVEAAVDRALGQADWNATGMVGGVLSGVYNTDAFNLAKTIDEIKSNIGFREIQTMRDNSPTGGALGQVAIQELQMLQATLGSLDQAQDGDQLRATLQRIKESMARWRQLQEAIANEGGQESETQQFNGFRVLD